MQSRSPLLLRLLHVLARLGLGLVLLLGLCVVMGSAVRTAHAATTLTVSTCDESHLDAAVAQANRDNAGDIITFACSGDIKLTSTLTISGSMTLSGKGQSVTLDGQNQVQVLSVQSGVHLTLNALTIAHGLAAFNGNDQADDGGGLYNNGGTVSITNSTFANNTAPESDCNLIFGQGGGLYNNGGTVSITNSTFANNTAESDTCSSVGGTGGGLTTSFGTVSITNSTFSGNSVTGSGSDDFGGGLYSLASTVSITNSTFSGNSALAGGGLSDFSGTMTISNSTIANNTATSTCGCGGFGGGLWNRGTVSITNSTFSGNTVPSTCDGCQGFGGGLFNSLGTVSISNSTIANNSDTSTCGGCGNGGGGLVNGGTVTISGSIVAENPGGDCVKFQDTFTDQGYNLDSDSSCFTAPTSLHGNPQLGPLASNGGPTQTLALLKGSPAIDAILLSSGLCPTKDQRGHKRPDNPNETACDIGAFES